ncbi:hypothetical protein DNFV4_01479 [Nitrospira tepida]|uniref:Uncharacterized protein n=1 Tax=Nitrospira tepida TaxID=2973512 RepID=A0AA86MXX4_9BACT|nr:hypothetical protein [Nitrospira tepida]CAI4031047.1 hypothetical protein DNFV4_01479 [Nitrospira tepida]
MTTTPRTLSFDEKLAAEAAFAGRPFNPKWSAAARTVYRGIRQALAAEADTLDQASMLDPGPVPDAGGEAPAIGADSSLLASRQDDRHPFDPPSSDESHIEADDSHVALPHEQVLHVGEWIEITSMARNLGVPFTVGMTQPAWETLVTASASVPESEHAARVRDILLALRLRLMSAPANKSVIDVPALLPFPPDTVPRPRLLLAAFHQSPNATTFITLLLPRELSALLSNPKEE